METEIVAALIGVAGSMIIGWAIYAAQNVVGRAAATMEMLKEFNGAEMSESRSRARRHVIANIQASFSEMEEAEPSVATGLSPAEHLYVLMRFYHRLNALRESRLLSDSKLLRLFGPTFAYWWAFSFEQQMMRTDNWRTRHDMQRLYEFFGRRVAAEARHNDWANWLADGMAERNKALAQNAQRPQH